MDVRRDKPQEQFEISFDEVKNDLVVVVYTVHFCYLGARTCAKCHICRTLFDTPSILSEDISGSAFISCSKKLKSNEDSEASYVDLIVRKWSVSTRHLILPESLRATDTNRAIHLF